MKKHPGLIALLCVFLWGSAGSFIKQGYAAFGITTTPQILLFAGLRFFLAGLMVLAVPAFRQDLPQQTRKSGFWSAVLWLAMLQTAGQYFFYYIGLAHISGVTGAILTGSGAFLTVLAAVYVFGYEKMNGRKLAAMLLAAAGILIMNAGKGGGFSFSLNGELFILISQCCSAGSAGLIKKFGARFNPALLSGLQFMTGGLVLIIGAALAGGWLQGFSFSGLLILLYLAFVSAAAYTLWSLLLKYHDLSRIGMFDCLIPVFGIICSALVLGEYQQALAWPTWAAAACIVGGIILINRGQPNRTVKQPEKPEVGN